MSVRTLPVLTHPDFPQVFAAAIDSEVTAHFHPQPQLSLCCYVSPTDEFCGGGFECNQPAIVHHVATEMDYCAAHWKVVGRG